MMKLFLLTLLFVASQSVKVTLETYANSDCTGAVTNRTVVTGCRDSGKATACTSNSATGLKVDLYNTTDCSGSSYSSLELPTDTCFDGGKFLCGAANVLKVFMVGIVVLIASLF
mmetsp:Transcript_20257/g.17922  ORF Transcript_20257/g.17922 Transcript_20257/m.17922 type:complete len:114 (-) Transcript_20257:106-447(-)